MPFVRFSRDKKGYEHVYLVHTIQEHGRGAQTRVLYWYRTPPGVKVGREPFDPAVRKALEAGYPSIQFDWKRIVRTPMPPPPEAENWRERRRAERAMKQARAADEREVENESAPEPQASAAAEAQADVAPLAASGPGGESSPALPPQPGEVPRKRRRRGGRRRRRAGQAAAPPIDAPNGDAPNGADASRDRAEGDTLEPQEGE